MRWVLYIFLVKMESYRPSNDTNVNKLYKNSHTLHSHTHTLTEI